MCSHATTVRESCVYPICLGSKTSPKPSSRSWCLYVFLPHSGADARSAPTILREFNTVVLHVTCLIDIPQGLYRVVDGQREPFLPEFLAVHVVGSRPRDARVDTSPVVIVNLRLASLADAGSPAQVVHATLMAYFLRDAASLLHYIDAPYNLRSNAEAAAHRDGLDTALRVLDRSVLVTISIRYEFMSPPGFTVRESCSLCTRTPKSPLETCSTLKARHLST